MIHLRLVVPAAQIEGVKQALLVRDDVQNVVHLPGAALRPPGDVLLCDVTRPSTDELLAELHAMDIAVRGSITVETMDAVVSEHPQQSAADAESAESVVWETVEAVTENGVRGDWTYHVFLTLSVTLAAIAVKLDSAIMVIAAMVVSPDFSPVAAICVGIVRRRRRDLIRRGLSLLASGFAFSILAVTVLAFFAVWAGWIGLADLLAPRPQTGFIWAPDRWSFVVALLAGAAGTLSLTSSRSNALVGVFIAVTTVPAAGALSFALAVGLYETLSGHGATVFALHGRLVHELTGSALQLVINLVGMVLAGIAALWVTQGFDERTARRGRDPVVP